jgi:peptidoglycan L-alanyl-D-glutamate endopeptidase CwlK
MMAEDRQTARTERCLREVHPDLAAIFRRARDIQRAAGKAEPVVTCGKRTVAEQRELVAKGASKTMNSRHIPGRDGYSRAIDICFIINGRMDWSWPLYKGFADMMKQAAKELKLSVEWGGDWAKFKDGPHFQLPFAKYPN